MKTITASNQLVFIDDEDYERVNQLHWRINGSGYVVHDVYKGVVFLHRFVLNYEGDLVIDHHPDKDPKNNQKSNLRIVEEWVNHLPKQGETRPSNTSGVNGIHQVKATGKFEAYISINDEKRYLGTFNTLEEARQEREGFEKAMMLDPTLRAKPEKRKNNKSGVNGVCFNTRSNRWKAKIGAKHLGFFKTFEEAVNARKQAEQNWSGNKESFVRSI